MVLIAFIIKDSFVFGIMALGKKAHCSSFAEETEPMPSSNISNHGKMLLAVN